MRLLLAAALAALAVGGGGSPQVVARTADGEAVAELPVARTFALEYLHSYYRAPARETFRLRPDGFELAAIASPSEAVLDYYEIEGQRIRRGGWWTLRPQRPTRFETLALAATDVGRRTLVAGGRPTPLYGRGHVHLRIEVER